MDGNTNGASESPTLSGLRLKPYFSLIIHGPDHVELRSGGFNALSHFLKDEDEAGNLAAILSNLDGRPARDVAKAAGASRAEVESVVDHLIEIGAVQSAPNSALDAYFDRIVPTLRTRDTPLSASRAVTILGGGSAGSIIAEAIAQLLPDAEIDVLAADAPLARDLSRLKLAEFDSALDSATLSDRFGLLKDQLLIVSQIPVDPHAALVLNRLAHALDIPMLWGAIDGPALFVGPFTLPGKAACFECFETRVMMNLRESAAYQRYKAALAEGLMKAAPLPVEAALQHVLAGHMAMEAVNYLTTGSAFCIGKALCLYLPTMEFTYNDVLRLPNCPSCAPRAYVDEPELYYDMRAVIGGEVTP